MRPSKSTGTLRRRREPSLRRPKASTRSCGDEAEFVLGDEGIDDVGDGGAVVTPAHEARTTHILNGEVSPNGAFGGGHLAGTGFPKKSEFSVSWSDEQVTHNISDVATDPSLAWRASDMPGDFWVNGTRDGVDIEVLIRDNEIWTGYPSNFLRNP